MLLVEEGIIRTSDLVSKYIPEFGVGIKAEIRIAHLLTHTSGLPDMLPNNIELRQAGVRSRRVPRSRKSSRTCLCARALGCIIKALAFLRSALS